MMMNRTRSDEGATILIALLFFLLCAVAGSIVLAAGTSAAGKVSSLATEKQSYYSVISAAKLLREEMDGKSLYCYTEGSSGDAVFYVSPDSDISSTLKNAVNAVVTGADTYEDTLTIKTEDDDVNKAMGTVTGALTIDSKYNIEITLSSDADKSYKCRVVAPAVIQDNKDKTAITTVDADGNKTTRNETKLVWSGVKIENSNE